MSFRVAKLWLCIRTLCEVHEAAPWASWRPSDYNCATWVSFLKTSVCFTGSFTLAMNVRLTGGCFEREGTYLKLVQYKALLRRASWLLSRVQGLPRRQRAVVLPWSGTNNPQGTGAAEVMKCLKEKVLTIKGWIHSPVPQTRGHVSEECVSKDNTTFRELYLQVSNSSLKEVSLCGRLFMGAIWIEL